MDIGLILQLLNTGLSLWNSKEKNKYIDRKMDLERRFYEEYNKPLDTRSDAVLDNIYFELRILAIAFSSSVGAANTPNQ